MNASNGGSNMSKVPAGQAPGGNNNDMSVNSARVVKPASSDLTPTAAFNRGKNPYAPGGGK